jgi:anti-sigma factor RsiW
MIDRECAEMSLLVQADIDGELAPADTAGVEAHLEHCPNCAALQMQLIALSGRIRQEVTYHAAPSAAREKLRTAIRSRVAAIGKLKAQESPIDSIRRVSWRYHLSRSRLSLVAPFGAGFALGACLVLIFMLPQNGDLPNAVVSDHIRALQPGHLMDVVSTDQHTVKPWFDGRIDFAPPVRDFKDEGFPLAGGRLDYLDGRKVAALIYKRRKHLIDLYVWPDGDRLDHAPTAGSRNGYNFLHWSHDGMAFWAVSDLAASELLDFGNLSRASDERDPRSSIRHH